MGLFISICKFICIFAVVFFTITFVIYFYNLDMKFMALIEPLLAKHYDKVKKDKHL